MIEVNEPDQSKKLKNDRHLDLASFQQMKVSYKVFANFNSCYVVLYLATVSARSLALFIEFLFKNHCPKNM